MKKTGKKLVTIFLVFALIFTSFSPTLAATQGSDVKGHWAEAEIEAWMGQGLVAGYPDGSFKPNRSITRAEFMALVNRSFGFMERGDVSFTDVKKEAWFAEVVAVSSEAGYISGYQDGSMKPSEPISRQEVASILARVNGLDVNAEEANRFKDSIPQWSKGSVGAVASAEFMSGYPNGNFEPQKSITRAEAVVTLDRNVKSEFTTYDTPGVYGPESGTETVQGFVVVSSEDVTLRNLVIEGNLVIAASVGEGDVTLKNVTVKGVTNISGGGENSIHAENSTLDKVVVKKENNKVRLVATGTTTINDVSVYSGATLQGQSGFKNVTVDAPGNSDIVLNGNFDTVDVNSSGAKINLPSGASIKTLSANAAVEFTGAGRIDTANVNAGNVKFQTQPTNVNVKAGISAPTTGTPVSSGGGSSSSSGGDNGGGQQYDVKSIEDIVVNKAVGESYQLPAKVTATLNDDSTVERDVTWDGIAYTSDVGTFEYTGAVTGYSGAVKLTLKVTLEGYSENADGTVATVTSTAAAAHAKNVISLNEVVVAGNVTLPADFILPISVNADGVTVDLGQNAIPTVKVTGKNVTLQNGRIENLTMSEGLETLKLENVTNESHSEFDVKAGLTSLKLTGSSDLSGALNVANVTTGDSIRIIGEGTGKISGTVNVTTSSDVILVLPITNVIVEAVGAKVTVGDNQTIDTMMVREDATINLAPGASITNRHKRAGVTVTVNTGAEFSALMFSALSTPSFDEVLDKVSLNRYLGIANNFLAPGAVQVGDQDGQFPQAAVDALTTAKNAAKTIFDNSTLVSHQDNVDAATTNLKLALETFGNARIFLDTSNFRQHVRAMEQLLARTSVGQTHGHAPEAAYNTFKQAVEAAKTALTSNLSQARLTEEADKLKAAETALRSAIIAMPFFSPDTFTLEGEANFVLPNANEVFTDYVEFKIFDKENNMYIRTGWSIHSGNRTEGWTTLKATKLNSSRVNFKDVTHVYYTVASSQQIYNGSFTVADFVAGKSINLQSQVRETGTITVNVDFAGTDFTLENIIVERQNPTDDKWHYHYQVAETTQLPVGTYKVKVHGYDSNHEYFLIKDVVVSSGANTVTYTSTNVDTVSLEWENFTGFEIKRAGYQPEGFYYRYWYRHLDEVRQPSTSLKLSDTLNSFYAEYFANHTARDEQWRFRVYIPRNKGQNETILTSPHFEIQVGNYSQGMSIKSTDKLNQHLSVNIKNDLGHQLNNLYFYYDHTFQQYGGTVTVKQGTRSESKTVTNIWDFNDTSVEEILPGVTGEVEITFSMGETPFLIPDKTITVNVAN